MPKFTIALAFIFTLLNFQFASANDICRRSVPESYSGVYSGWLDTFGVCESDTAKGTVYVNYETSPVTIIYDGVVLRHYSYVGEEVYYTGNYKQILLGVFEKQNNIDGFLYKRILNHFYAGDEKMYKPFFWAKVQELDVNNPDYQAYLADYKSFQDMWSAFETAFFKKDIDKLAEFCRFPIMDNTQNPPVIIDKDKFAAFMTKIFDNTEAVHKGEGKYDGDLNFPQRFGDHDPCFAKSYTWSYSTPRLNFTKVSGTFKFTGTYEYE